MVRIKKIAESPDENACKAADWGSYAHGTCQAEGKSIPIEYEVEGILLGKIEVGCSVVVARTKRNGVKIGGFFQTTAVQSLTDKGFLTKNSKYIVEEI